MIDGLENVDLIAKWNEIVAWTTGYLLTPNTLYQGYIIAISFVFGLISYRLVRQTVQNLVNNLDIPYRAKKIAHNVRRLLFPTTTLIIMFVLTQVAGSEQIGLDVFLMDSIMKVILAWIIIRIIVQFIDNNEIRNIFAFGIWAIAVLSIFGLMDEAKSALDAVGFSIGDVRLSALAVLKGFVYLFTLLYFATFISSFAERRVLKSKTLTRSSQVLISKIIRVVLIVVALLIGVTSSGIDLSLFAVFGGAVGVGVGFGLQKGISNLFSGMLLLLDKSIKPGDVIELENGTFGWVNHMAARYTEIVTRDNKSFLIPNEEFISNRVINWSHGNSLIRVEVYFGVHYDSNPHQIIDIAQKAALTCESRVCESPAPLCHFTEFGDSSLNFRLRFWIKDAEKGVTNIKGEVMLALWDAFDENNVNIPYPHREVFIHNVDAQVEDTKKTA